LNEINTLQRYFSSKKAPMKFGKDDAQNKLRAHFQSFEDSITALEENGVNNAKSLTLFEYRSKVAYYIKRIEESKKNNP
jgi:hypothetical protein